MKKLIQPSISFDRYLQSGEEVLFTNKIDRFLRESNYYLLSNYRLYSIGKEGIEEKALFFPGEGVVAYETGEQSFTGNVHLLTNQRVLILEVGAKDYLLESIPLSQIAKLDLTALTEKWGHSFVFGLRFYLENDEMIDIQHGRITTGGIHEQILSEVEGQQLHERFPRKICELAGMKFAAPQLRKSLERISTVDFYNKSDLLWPQKCAACLQSIDTYAYDECTVENSWFAAGYSFDEGLISEITYKIPYCLPCFIKRFGSGINNRAVKAGPAGSNGARVELCFENPMYAMEFIQLNSK